MSNFREKRLLCGREFTEEEIEDIKYIVQTFSKFTRAELANTVCENLDWVDAKGKNKSRSALELLEKLERWGEIILPAKKGRGGGKRKEIVFTEATAAPQDIVFTDLGEIEPVQVEPVLEQMQARLWNEYIARYHYLGYKVPFGAHQKYFIVSGSGVKLGCILFAAAAWALTARDNWIGWTEEDRSRRLNLIVNNTRFLIFPWVQVKNLASRSLSLVSKRVRKDWLDRYGYEPVIMETFVDTERYRGTCYRAANWIYLGETAGRGRMDRYSKRTLSIKQVYMYPLVKDFREHLCDSGGKEADNDITFHRGGKIAYV